MRLASLVDYLWIDAICTIQGWHDIVHSYIPLSLTFDSDRLPALSSPAKRMQKQLDYDYLAVEDFLDRIYSPDSSKNAEMDFCFLRLLDV